MMAGRILVAGASGRLGRHLVQELKNRGYFVRALARDSDRLRSTCAPADEHVALDALTTNGLRSACNSMDCIISCIGASVIPSMKHGRTPFSRLDVPANERLIEAAVTEKTDRFVYFSVFTDGKLPDNDFVRSHEQVAAGLKSAVPRSAIVQATGFFSSLSTIMRKSSLGLLPVSNGGSARTNPIHEADLADFCADIVDTGDLGEFAVGGPEVFTRKEIAGIVLSASRQTVPAVALRRAAALIGPVNPRVAELYRFIEFVLSSDVIAPRYGWRTLRDHIQGIRNAA